MMNNQQANQILEFRKKDTMEAERERFVEWINNDTIGDEKHYKINEGKFSEILVYDNGLRFCEMWKIDGEVIRGELEKYCFFDKTFNTRTKRNAETCLEIDKLDFEKSWNIICEVVLSLMRNDIHFAVFYAKGQRSPHIRIYDFEELELLNPKQRIKAQIEFWRRHVPFGCFQYIDSGMFVDKHTLQLEFSIHWKYRTMFKLLFEYVPEVKDAKVKE